MILRQVDQVVQVAGRQHDQRVCLRMLGQQRGGIAPDAVQVVDIVGAVVARGGGGQSHEAGLPGMQQFIRFLRLRHRLLLVKAVVHCATNGTHPVTARQFHVFPCGIFIAKYLGLR